MPRVNEIVQLQQEISHEIETDAPHIARMVFGDTKTMPDVVGLPNEQLDRIYRQAYLNEDRTFLQAEARRDPLQFEKIAQRIGVKMPEPLEGMAEMPKPGSFAKVAASPPSPANMAPSVPPLAAPSAPVPPVPALLPSPPPAPVILGPNGMPLPPSGAPLV